VSSDHQSGCAFHNVTVSLIRLGQIKGDPPSAGYISRPFISDLNDSPRYLPSPRDTHEALAVLLANTRKVFESFKASLLELDA